MQRKTKQHGSRMPSNSFFFGKVVPILMVALGILLVVIVLLAFGVAFDFIPVVY